MILAELDSLGGAGWTGAGLLGVVLSWLLFKHIPDKDKQLADLLTAKDTQIDAVVTKFESHLSTEASHGREERRQSSEEWQAVLKEHRETFDRQLTDQRKQSLSVATANQSSIAVLGESFAALTEWLNSQGSSTQNLKPSESGIQRMREARARRQTNVLEDES